MARLPMSLPPTSKKSQHRGGPEDKVQNENQTHDKRLKEGWSRPQHKSASPWLALAHGPKIFIRAELSLKWLEAPVLRWALWSKGSFKSGIEGVGRVASPSLVFTSLTNCLNAASLVCCPDVSSVTGYQVSNSTQEGKDQLFPLWEMWEVGLQERGSGFALMSMELQPLLDLFRQGSWYFQRGSETCSFLSLFVLLARYLFAALPNRSFWLFVVLGHKPSISSEKRGKKKCSQNGSCLYNIQLTFLKVC